MTVAHLRRSMPEAEFNEWLAFYAVEAKLRKDAQAKVGNMTKGRRRRR